jgi:hypothetical protein
MLPREAEFFRVDCCFPVFQQIQCNLVTHHAALTERLGGFQS